MRVFGAFRLGSQNPRVSSLLLTLCVLATAPRSDALEVTIVADEVTTQATVITRTNNKGYNVVFWNFFLPPTFSGTGEANTVTSMNFQFFQNSPQGGGGVLPENIAIYNGFFDPGRYSTVQGSNLFKPNGNSYSTPISYTGMPAHGINTVQVADTASGQLNMGTLTPGVNEQYGSHNFIIPTTQAPFNGTGYVDNGTPVSNNGQYSLVIWTESTQNYQWKGGGQLRMSIPGVSGIMTSVSPGYLDGSGGGAGVVTAAGSLAIAPVPEPSTIVMGIIASGALAFAAWRKRGNSARKATC